METRQLLKPNPFSSSIAAMVLGMTFFILAIPRTAAAQVTFDVSAIFADNNSTPLRGTITINTTTGTVAGFYVNIPIMTIGSTTLADTEYSLATGERRTRRSESQSRRSARRHK